MKIIDTYKVTISGQNMTRPGVTLVVQADDGSYHPVELPSEDLLEPFRWLSEQDYLRHLISLEPEWTDNHADVIFKQMHLLSTKAVTRALEENYCWSATWEFTDKAAATLFKLTWGTGHK